MPIGIKEMSSLLSSANALKNINNLSASKTQMDGQSRILSAEIKADKDRGVDTKKKEEKLADAEERLLNIEGNIGDSLNELNERLEADREKIREEEAEQARQVKAADTKTEAVNDTVSGSVANADSAVSGVTDPADTLEISPEAKAAAAADSTVHAAYTPIASVPVQSTGQVIDKKV